MQEAIQPTSSTLEAADPVVAAALRADAWAGEPFVREGEDPAEALAEGTARRRALDEALAEMDAGRKTPSPQWKVRFGLLLGGTLPPSASAGALFVFRVVYYLLPLTAAAGLLAATLCAFDPNLIADR